jgi:hypothetical protein
MKRRKKVRIAGRNSSQLRALATAEGYKYFRYISSGVAIFSKIRPHRNECGWLKRNGNGWATYTA